MPATEHHASPDTNPPAGDSPTARLLREDAGSFATIARQIPAARGSSRLSPSTLFRWHKTGVVAPDGRRIYLEAFRTPGGYRTSLAAVIRFLDQLTPVPLTDGSARPTPRSPAVRRKAAEHAARECERLGL